MTDQVARPPLPPFSYEDAVMKVRKAEDAWNGQQPEQVAQAYTPDSSWRNRSQFLQGRAEIVLFLKEKWIKEKEYRLIKEIWAHGDHRIAVRFAYEWQDVEGKWFRSYGNENWEFDDLGYMKSRHASINDVSINEGDRLFLWPCGQARAKDYPGLSELGL